MTLGIRRVGFHRSNHTGSLRPIQGLGSLAAGTPEGSPPAMTETAVLVPDLIEVHVPVGGRVLVVSDIHLARESTTASIFAATELAQTVESWTGPGVIVLAGDCFELLEGTVHDPRPALQTHARFADALKNFSAADGRQVICLPGNHDGRLAWDERAVAGVRESTGADMALAVELVIATGRGERRVHVEAG